jgi:hypothetical protein
VRQQQQEPLHRVLLLQAPYVLLHCPQQEHRVSSQQALLLQGPCCLLLVLP